MSYIFLYLLLPFFALLVDSLISYARFARVSIVAIPVPGVHGPDQGYQVACRELIVAVQNNEPRLVTHRHNPIEIVLVVRSKHAFCQKKYRQPDIVPSCGPDDRIEAKFRGAANRTVVLRLPYLRPLKTWTFRVRMDARVQEVVIDLRIPKGTPLRRGLQRINEHSFRFEDIGYFSTEFVVRDRPVRVESKRFPNGALPNLFIPLMLLAGAAYVLFFGRVVVPVQNLYLAITDNKTLPWLLSASSLWLDAAIFAIGIGALYWFTRDEQSPVGDGYADHR